MQVCTSNPLKVINPLRRLDAYSTVMTTVRYVAAYRTISTKRS